MLMNVASVVRKTKENGKKIIQNGKKRLEKNTIRNNTRITKIFIEYGLEIKREGNDKTQRLD